MTHGVRRIDCKHYKHPLPEPVYDIYMRYWGPDRIQDRIILSTLAVKSSMAIVL